MEINLEQISKNLSKLRKGKICAVVKADAYHLGARKVSEYLDGAADFFAVATAEEALSLFGHVSKPILALNFPEKNLDELVRKGIRFSVFEDWQAKLLEYFPDAVVHLKFDSGMNRLGFRTTEGLKACFGRGYRIEGVYSHVFSEDPVCTRYQLDRFEDAVKECRRLHTNLLSHLGGSEICLRLGDFGKRDVDMTRAGIDLYRGCAKLKSRIISIKDVREGDYLSYGERTAERDSYVAVVSCGYADGVPRGLSDRFEVRVRGKMCPIVGKICMDMMLVDVTGASAMLGDEVLVFDGFAAPAEVLKTIDYEIMTGVSNRVERVYI